MLFSSGSVKKTICLWLAVLLFVPSLFSCDNTPIPVETTPSETMPSEPVTLRIAGAWPDCKAIEAVGRAFSTKYPNCTILYEYLQDYDNSLPKRMTGDNCVDIFFTNNIHADSAMLDYVVDLYSLDKLDLSHTYAGLIENAEFSGTKDSDVKKLYAVPLGAEMRGMFVNKTLLDSLNISIPTDQSSLLEACATLKANGYIPIHGNPGRFAQTLLYPWICNIIANSDDPEASYNKVNNREDGLGEMFSEPFEFLYGLVENYYYDYKSAQNNGNLFSDSSDEGYVRDFLNLRKNGEVWEKADDVGVVAFMPYTMSLISTLDKIKEDYHSEIEYVYMPAPVGPDGGFVYMSPARSLAVNKDSVNTAWVVEFLNFLYTPENNELFAVEFDVIPNTSDAFTYINTIFDVPASRISQLGQVTFDYDFYGAIVDVMVDISKGNNPKYMQTDDAGNTSLYPLSYYVDAFEEVIAGHE